MKAAQSEITIELRLALDWNKAGQDEEDNCKQIRREEIKTDESTTNYAK